MHMAIPCKSFYALDKFDELATILSSEGWERKQNESDGVDLIFTNLAKVDFKSLSPDVLVNHFRGSQHLSNKSFLAYHVSTAGINTKMMPPQWSAAFEDLLQLVGFVLEYSVYVSCQRLVRSNSSSISGAVCENVEFARIQEYRRIFNVLQQDNEWRNYDCLMRINTMLSHVSKDKKCIDAVPLKAELCNDSNTWKAQWGGEQNVWIVKPVGLSCGENITVVKGIKDVLAMAQSMKYKCVIQKYIERPLLIRGNRKFDIRQWILLTNVNPITIYGFSECYLRLSAEEYSLEEKSLVHPQVHLCNHAIQRRGASYRDTNSNDSSGLNCETMMSQEQFDIELKSILAHDNTDTNYNNKSVAINASPFNTIIKPKIKQIAIDVIKSVRDKLFKVGNGFEWLGLDLMVIDGTLEVVLLEVNVSPDVSHSTPVTSRLVTPSFVDLIRLVVDEDGSGRCTEGLVMGSRKKGCDNFSTRNTEESQPYWEEWYTGEEENYLQLRDFSKAKEFKCTLSSTYLPKKEEYATKVMSMFIGDTAVEDEDEM